jgi:hypothetical protein
MIGVQNINQKLKKIDINKTINFTYIQHRMFLPQYDSIFQTRQQIDNVQAKYKQFIIKYKQNNNKNITYNFNMHKL